ncbi:TPA: acyltransferase family protein [Klebsiella pneumoniae]
MAKERFDFIDSLRGLAILGVIFTHAGSQTLHGDSFLSKAIGKFVGFGGMGVPLFYVVSAFTIMLLYKKRYKTEDNYVLMFYIRRFMRIAPVYWGGIILYTLVYGVYESRGWQNSPELWHYPFHFLFINMTNPYTPSSVVPGGWSISNEVMFYVIFPLLFLLLKNLKQALIFFVLCVICSPVFEVLGNYFLESYFPDATGKYREQFTYRWLPNQLSCFAAGFVFYYMYIKMAGENIKERFTDKQGVYYMAVLIISIPFVILARKGPILENHFWAIWFVALATGLYLFNWTILVNKFMTWIGKISFSCYIFHFLIIKAVLSTNPFHGDVASFIYTSLLSLGITIAVASISFKYYESFFMKLTGVIIGKVNSKKIRAEQVE